MDMFNFAHDIDLFRIWAQMITGLLDTSNFSVSRPYHLMYLSRRDHIPYCYKHEEVVERFKGKIVMEQPVHPGLSLMGGHLYVFRTPDCIQELYQFADYAWERPDHQPVLQKNRCSLYPRPKACQRSDSEESSTVRSVI